ncbi:hypothetical protein [Paenibacillus piri]|uniref:Uncharacterized protein n=1 Tax=Paenibacillus piri TaxID=2547395 RepID=A0A4R5KZS9_9BACL|nr:hypothetical protein [Paenibacillus piri]TDG00591.1 hypothetical protein E1757_02895 [Paenibacillus piri]
MEQKSTGKFLFNVNILIEEVNNGRALEKLLSVLNTTEFEDYQIKDGIQLGKSIEIAMRETMNTRKLSLQQRDTAEAGKPQSTSPASSVAKEAVQEDPHSLIWEQFQKYKEDNTLIRLSAIKGKGVKLSVPCRILNVDPASGNVSVYHVDEKQVYLFNIHEIDDYVIHS